MQNSTKWLIGVGSVLLIVVFYVVSVFNTGVRYENELKSAYDNNQNVLSNSYYGPLEAAQLGEKKYKDMLLEMVKATSSGYQGATGGKAMMLWLGQTYPNISAELQLKIVTIGETGLAKFQASQTGIIDRGRAYKNYLGTFPSGTIAGMFGFPRMKNLDEILKPVTDDSTETSFKNKKRVPINQ